MEKLRLIDTDKYVYNMYQPKVLPGSDVYNKRVTAVLFSFVPSFVPSFVCFVLAFGVPLPLLLLNVVHVQVSEAEVSVDVLRLLPIVCIIEIKVLVVVLLVVKGVRLVHADVIRELAVRLERSRLVGHVFENDVRLLVLVVAEAHQNDVALMMM